MKHSHSFSPDPERSCGTILSDRSKKGRRIAVSFGVAFSLLLIVTCFFLSGCELGSHGGEITVKVPVMLADAEGITVMSENPCYVPLGGDAVFSVEAPEGLVINNLPGNASYHHGTITLSGVYFPTTLNLDTHQRVKCDFSAASASDEMGSVSSTLENGSHFSETEVTLSAQAAEGYLFVGFSVGETAENGGEIVSADATYTFTLSESVTLYANFASEWVDPALTVSVPKNNWILIYHSNGGVLSSTGEEGSMSDRFSSIYYHCPNTLADRDYFERDGYVLYGYNTAADGSGTYYAPGWNVVMPERGAISLFCMWAKVSDVSDFTYDSASDGGVRIRTYTGSDSFVVIPETINGKAVTEIGPYAFDQNKTMKSVMITKNIRTVYGAAFRSCTALESLYFSDSVTSIDDGAFAKCDNFSKLYMMAVVYPTYGSSRNGTYAIKFERLITAEGRKLVVISGSNTAYGIDSAALETLLSAGGQEFSVVNYGQNAGTAAAFYIEVISHFVNEGDIVLHAPECNKFQYGYNEINTTLWQIFEGAYDAFSYVDIREYSNLFSSFTTFNAARNQTSYGSDPYESYTKDTVNSYGDYSLLKEGYASAYQTSVNKYKANGGTGSMTFKGGPSYITSYGNAINRVYDMVSTRGGTVLFTFAAINRACLTSDAQTVGGAQQTAYEKAVDEYLHAARISTVSTYTMDCEYFYNSDYHLGTAGATERTKRIAVDLLAYFNAS